MPNTDPPGPLGDPAAADDPGGGRSGFPAARFRAAASRLIPSPVFRRRVRSVFLAAVFPALFSPAFQSCATVSPVDGLPLAAAASPESAVPVWRPFPGTFADGAVADGNGPGAFYCLAYFSGRVSRPRLEFHAVRLYLFSPSKRVAVGAGLAGAPDGETLSTRVSSFVRDKNLLAGINALPFDPVSGREGEPRTNVGLVIADGAELSPAHPRFDALVFFADGSAAVKPQTAAVSAENVENAVGGFFRILENGKPVPRTAYLTARHPRSAAGISPCGRFLYLLAIDGRRSGSVGATEAETALLLRALGASEGINFDGGGSTALAARFPDGTVRVLNTPVHGQRRGRERAVAGSLGIGWRGPQ